MESNPSQDNDCVLVIESQDINSDEQSVIRGDNIGDSTYSARWTLHTLLSLSRIEEQELSEEFETDLCYLWDMTTEKDVMHFLMNNDFISIAQNIFRNSEDRRLLEIVVGIIGNMCSQRSILQNISELNEFVDSIFDLLSSDDSGVLIQVVRILQATVWDLQTNESSKWREHLIRFPILGTSLTFILQSSTNSILLVNTLKFVQSISTADFSDKSTLLRQIFDINPLLLALIETLNQLIPSEEENDTSVQQDIIEIWLDILSNILNEEPTCITEIYSNISNILIKILKSKACNLTSLDESTASCIHECIEIVEWFQDKEFQTDIKLIRVVISIMYKLHFSSNSNQSNDTSQKLLEYLQVFWLHFYDEYGEGKIGDLWKECSREERDYMINL